MTDPVTAAAPTAAPARPRHAGAPVIIVVLVLITLLAYATSFRAPFELDDKPSVVDNDSIRQLWPLSVPLSPPAGFGHTVEGRPLLNLSFALNYAVGGLDVRGYHAVNLLIHLLAGLALFGVVRRTLRAPALRDRYGDRAEAIAGLTAALWLLHPLQTEAVTYIVQRAESLAGLFFWLTWYAYIRATESPEAAGTAPRSWIWPACSVGCCILGVATKETMVMAPVVVLLWDRAFNAGSFAAAWQRRRAVFVGYAVAWIVLGFLVVGAGSRGGTFALADAHAWGRYLLTQTVAVTTYVRLALVPSPLVFDRGFFWVPGWSALPHVAWVVALVAVTVVGVIRNYRWAVPAAVFFLTLAPSSVLPGTIQVIVEHRMYLPLAAVAVGLALAMVELPRWARLAGAVALPGLLAILTLERNHAYRSEVALWSDTVAKAPANGRAFANQGAALYATGALKEANVTLEHALRLDPANPEAHFNHGLTLLALRRPAEAVDEFAAAVRFKPAMAAAEFEKAAALLRLDRRAEAEAALRRALAIRPDYAEAHNTLGALASDAGRHDEAVRHFRRALALRPGYADAEMNLGAEWVRMGRLPDGIGQLENAVRHAADSADAYFNLGLAYAAADRGDDARRAYAAAVRLNPRHFAARLNLGIAYVRVGRTAEALEQLQAAEQLQPDSPELQQGLALALVQAERIPEAIAHYQRAIAARPTYASAHYNLGNAFVMLRRLDDARTQFEQALACDPAFEAAREMLTRIDAASR